MKVARHEMPGTMCWGGLSRKVRYDQWTVFDLFSTAHEAPRHESYRSLRDGSCLPISQAFHAWLPSCGPYGTIRRLPPINLLLDYRT